MIKNLIALLGLTIALSAIAQTDEPTKSDYDLDAPFGFCTVSSRTTNTPYSITGGGCYQYPVTGVAEGKVTTLTSNGTDMRNAINNAINDYDVIVFDGSNGDFIVSKSIDIEGKSGKTLLGINGARLCTQWYLTSDLIAALDAAGVKSKSTGNKKERTLPNGKTEELEECEFYVRSTLINETGDNNENYRKAGIFNISKNSENIIIRNITFQGPGAVDVGGYDLISITQSSHIWVDHCVFKDGEDGNLDITNASNFNTISWCTFSYSNRSYMHQNTNLVGSSDSEATGNLNTTYAFNWWGKGCDQRMPMARVGKIHLLNNYYTCNGCHAGVNPRKYSEFLIEGNYFDTGVKNYYGKSDDATAVTWTENNYVAETKKHASAGSTVTVPYTYTANPYSIVPTDVRQFAGATLFPEYNQEAGVKGSIIWPLNSVDTEQTSSTSSTISEGIGTTSVTHGTGVHTNGNVSINNSVAFVKYQPDTANETAASAANTITFTFNIQEGYKFQAKNILFYASKIGTDNGKLDAIWHDANGEIEVLKSVSPNRNKAENGWYSAFNESISDKTEEVTGECSLAISIYNLGSGSAGIKDIALANVAINGTIVAPTGISTSVTFTLPVTTEYYNLAGQQVSSNTKGIVIEKQRMQDGTVKTNKKIRR